MAPGVALWARTQRGLDLLQRAGAGRQQIAAAVGWAALGYEIVDCHYPGWALTPPDMVADFGCHAALIIGTRRRTTVEQVLALSGLTITLRCDDEDVATGNPLPGGDGKSAAHVRPPLMTGKPGLRCSLARPDQSGSV